jgi:hypothetical protein
MRQNIPSLVVVLGGLSLCSSSNCASAQEFEVPRDGMFYIEARPAFTFKATLADDMRFPHAGAGTLYVYAPVMPELPSQSKVSTRLFVANNEKRKAKEITEESVYKRRMLALAISSKEMSPKAGIPSRLTYEGTLFSRSLQRGKSPKEVPDLTKEERRRYLMTSTTIDYKNAEFVRWMNDQGLKRRKDEQAMAFAHRVFAHFIKNAKYGGDTSSYESRRPSRVCKSFTNDCGGLSLLFVAVMRANDVPARALFGRWAISQTDADGQFHVIAEFFVEKSGWVPVDVAGTIVHKPKDPYAFFGNTDGQFMIFHIDPDMLPARGFYHAWAQYVLLQWSGDGDFWKEHRVDGKWEVTRQAIEK